MESLTIVSGVDLKLVCQKCHARINTLYTCYVVRYSKSGGSNEYMELCIRCKRQNDKKNSVFDGADPQAKSPHLRKGFKPWTPN